MDKSTLEVSTITGPMHAPLRHDSAHKHVAGTADYIDDMPEPAGTLHGALGLTDRAHAEILEMDLSDVAAVPGVVCVITAGDMPHSNDISPTHLHDEPVLADGRVEFHGQPAFAVIAETRDIARRAARLAMITYRDFLPAIDVIDAVATGGELVTPPLTLERGDAEGELERAPRRIQGHMRIGGQEHFYLEGHIALAIPGEDDEMTVWVSTQHPSEVQRMVAQVLGVPSNAVTVNVRRNGSAASAGKETQAISLRHSPPVAARKASAAPSSSGPGPGRRHDRTGKRHDFSVDYRCRRR